jgi:glycerophosphoryl diester phosphodiesterase
MTAWVFDKGPTLVGHRGMGRGTVDGFSENTIASFLAAMSAGLEWVELDVRLTRDDVLMVTHDPVLRDGTPLAELSAVEAERRGITRLEELLEALPTNVGVAIDVKSSFQDAVRPAGSTTAALLARLRAVQDRPTLGLSFDPAALQHMREEAPGIALGLLTWLRFPIGHAVAAAAHLDVQVLAVHAGSLSRSAATGRAPVPPLGAVVAALHERRRQLLVWCPSARRARSLAAAGVDAMVVDDVPRHLRNLERSPRRCSI